jgi:hypothetical protein
LEGTFEGILVQGTQHDASQRGQRPRNQVQGSFFIGSQVAQEKWNRIEIALQSASKKAKWHREQHLSGHVLSALSELLHVCSSFASGRRKLCEPCSRVTIAPRLLTIGREWLSELYCVSVVASGGASKITTGLHGKGGITIASESCLLVLVTMSLAASLKDVICSSCSRLRRPLIVYTSTCLC